MRTRGNGAKDAWQRKRRRRRAKGYEGRGGGRRVARRRRDAAQNQDVSAHDGGRRPSSWTTACACSARSSWAWMGGRTRAAGKTVSVWAQRARAQEVDEGRTGKTDWSCASWSSVAVNVCARACLLARRGAAGDKGRQRMVSRRAYSCPREQHPGAKRPPSGRRGRVKEHRRTLINALHLVRVVVLWRWDDLTRAPALGQVGHEPADRRRRRRPPLGNLDLDELLFGRERADSPVERLVKLLHDCGRAVRREEGRWAGGSWAGGGGGCRGAGAARDVSELAGDRPLQQHKWRPGLIQRFKWTKYARAGSSR